jgi:hypothetical protein
VKKNLLFVCFLALRTLTLFGQTEGPAKVVHIEEKWAIHIPADEAPANLKIIYSNLGTPTSTYNVAWGWAVGGPNSHEPEFIALPFTPTSDSHVSQVRAAVQYFSGANQVNLSLYADADGVPGTLLAGPVTVTNLPEEGTCCALAVADFSPLALTAGTQYWVVADTPLSGTGSDLLGQWNWVAKASVEWAQDYGGEFWGQIPSDALPAGAVLGTVP